MGWTWRFILTQIQRSSSFARGSLPQSRCLAHEGTLDLAGSYRLWICMCVWPWSVACVLWAYSIKTLGSTHTVKEQPFGWQSVTQHLGYCFESHMQSVSAIWGLQRCWGKRKNSCRVGLAKQIQPGMAWALHVSRPEGGIVSREVQSCGYIGPKLSALLCDQSPSFAVYIWR